MNATSSLAKKSAYIDVAEMNLFGELVDNLTSNFTMASSALSFKKIKSGQNRIFPLKAKSKGYKGKDPHTTVTWDCYSDTCPDFIRVNDLNLTVHIDGTKTYGKDA